jgi:hypothetical protein
VEGGPVWYAAYGSNLDADRFRCYLQGGCPPGATRTYPGAREPGEPLDVRPFEMPGRLAFAWESPTWGGGIAFHQRDVPGTTLARAYLVTVRQFVDVLEQEMRRDPGVDHDLAPVIGGERHAVGPGRYETLDRVGELDGRPVLTFSSPDVLALGLRAPAPAYLATIARGLRQAHGLADEEVVDYLAGCPGVHGKLARAEVAAAVAQIV